MIASIIAWKRAREYRLRVERALLEALAGAPERSAQRTVASISGFHTVCASEQAQNATPEAAALRLAAVVLSEQILALPHSERASVREAFIDTPSRPSLSTPKISSWVKIVGAAEEFAIAAESHGAISETEHEIFTSEIVGSIQGESHDTRVEGRLKRLVIESFVSTPKPSPE